MGTTRLFEIRKASGLTQEALAAKTRLAQSNISRLETGKLPMTLKMAKRLAEALKVKPTELLDL